MLQKHKCNKHLCNVQKHMHSVWVTHTYTHTHILDHAHPVWDKCNPVCTVFSCLSLFTVHMEQAFNFTHEFFFTKRTDGRYDPNSESLYVQYVKKNHMPQVTRVLPFKDNTGLRPQLKFNAFYLSDKF